MIIGVGWGVRWRVLRASPPAPTAFVAASPACSVSLGRSSPWAEMGPLHSRVNSAVQVSPSRPRSCALCFRLGVVGGVAARPRVAVFVALYRCPMGGYVAVRMKKAASSCHRDCRPPFPGFDLCCRLSGGHTVPRRHLGTQVQCASDDVESGQICPKRCSGASGWLGRWRVVQSRHARHTQRRHPRCRRLNLLQ